MKNPDTASSWFPPKCLLLRSQLAALLGEIAAESARVEFRITRLYGILLGIRTGLPIRKDTEFGYTINFHIDDLAMQIFEAVITVKARIKLLKKIAKSEISAHRALITELDKVCEDIQNASDCRNTFIHGLWGISDDYPDALILHSESGGVRRRLVYKESDFNDAISRIIKAGYSITEFEEHLIDALQTR